MKQEIVIVFSNDKKINEFSKLFFNSLNKNIKKLINNEISYNNDTFTIFVRGVYLVKLRENVSYEEALIFLNKISITDLKIQNKNRI